MSRESRLPLAPRASVGTTERARHSQGRPRLTLVSAPRLLGPNERFFVSLRRFTATNVIRVICFEEGPAPELLERALQKLEARHPLLRARIVPPLLLHDRGPALSLQRERRRGDADVQRRLEQLLDQPIDIQRGPLFRFHYLWSEQAARAELLVVGDHAVCDGVSLNGLCAELLALASGAPSEPPLHTRPALLELLPRFELHRRVAAYVPSLARFARLSLLRALLERPLAARRSAHVFTELDQAETAALVARARAAGTSVTGALMAAVVEARRAAGSTAPRLALSVPVNLRPRVAGEPLSASDLGNYTSVAYVESPGAAEFWPLARTLKRELDRHAASEQLLPALTLVYETGRRLVRPHAPPLAHAMISNSGVVPIAKSYNGFRVARLLSASSAPMLAADVACFCNTLHGRLTVNLVFGEEALSRREAERMLERLRQSLTRA